MSLWRAILLAVLLWVICFVLALRVDPLWRAWQDEGGRTEGVLSLLLGDGRRLLGNHFFAKADAYFHRGIYPGIFDAPHREEMHLVTAGREGETGMQVLEEGSHSAEPGDHAGHDAAHTGDEHDDHDHGGEAPPPGDWIAWLNSRLQPAGHVHLSGGEEREMLPWLKLSLELEPKNPQAFVTTAYWLRAHLNNPDEAERVLREGLRANPNDPALLLELGTLLLDARHDLERARNVLEQALTVWLKRESVKPDPDYLMEEGILGRLASIEEATGNPVRAIFWLQQLEKISPRPEAIGAHIRALQGELPPGATESQGQSTAPATGP